MHNVSLVERFMEGMGAEQQAELFKNSSATLQVLGAANVNAMFQPIGSLVVLATPMRMGGQSKYELDLYRDLAAAGHNITAAHMGDVPLAHVQWAALFGSGGYGFYRDLSDKEKVEFLRHGSCPPHLSNKCGNVGFFSALIDLTIDFMDAALGNITHLAGLQEPQRHRRLAASRQQWRDWWLAEEALVR